MVRAWVASLFLLLSFGAGAAPITFAFTGVLDQLPVLDPASPFPDPVDDTTPFSGTYTFDGAAVDGAADPQSGAYQSDGAPYGFTLTIGGLMFGYSSVSVVVANDFVGLGDLYGASFAEPAGCGKFTCAFFSLSLIDPSALALASDALPLKPPAFGSFLYSTFLYQDTVGDDQIELDGVLTSLVCTAGCTVPEPSTPSIVAGALAALVVLRRRSLRMRRVR